MTWCTLRSQDRLANREVRSIPRPNGGRKAPLSKAWHDRVASRLLASHVTVRSTNHINISNEVKASNPESHFLALALALALKLDTW